MTTTRYPVLDTLMIKRANRWKSKLEDPIRYEGEIEFLGEHGETTLYLNDEISRLLINVVADQVVESSKEIAIKLAAEFLSGDSLLSPPAEQESTDSENPREES